ncbi:MAG TPA: hypothetical protein PLM61_01100 [Thermoanaerobaculales bacterium]|nr:hypothetical protein [Thermoanaerobaculales bacterium]
MSALRGFRSGLVWLVAAVSLLPLWVALRTDHRLLGEDPLITLTFAKNLARGDGFVFNHPPPVLGTTSPLFALLAGALDRLLPGAEPTAIAVWLSAACWVAVLWLILWFAGDLGLSSWQVAAIAGTVTATGWVTRLEFEAYLFAALLVLAIGLYARGRPAAAGAVAGLLFLTRGEGLLLFGLLAAATALSELRGRSPRPAGPLGSATARLAAGFGVPVLAWTAYALPTFGGVLPNTLAAKIAQGSSGLWQPFLGQLATVWLPAWGRPLALGSAPLLSLAWALVAVGLVVMVRRGSRLLLLVAWTAAYIAGYAALGVAGYPWYACPVYLALAVLLGVGLGSVAGGLAARVRPRAIGVALAGACLAAVLLPLGAPTAVAVVRRTPSQRHLAYYEMARWFRDHVPADASIAYHEVGYLGYYTDNRIVDLLGLVTPGLTEHVAAGDFAWGFWRERPDYLVYLEGSRFFEGILRDPRFAAGYRPVVTLAGYDGKSLTIFGRAAGP